MKSVSLVTLETMFAYHPERFRYFRFAHTTVGNKPTRQIWLCFANKKEAEARGRAQRICRRKADEMNIIFELSVTFGCIRFTLLVI